MTRHNFLLHPRCPYPLQINVLFKNVFLRSVGAVIQTPVKLYSDTFPNIFLTT